MIDTGRALVLAALCGLAAACATAEQEAARDYLFEQCYNDDRTFSVDTEILACSNILNSHERFTPDLPQIYAQRALAYGKKGEFAKAVADFTEASLEDPFDGTLVFGKGIILERMGDVSGALTAYDAAIRLSPRMHQAYVSRGELQLEEGNDELAAGDFGEAIRLRPDYADAFVGRAQVHIRRKVYSLAINDLDTALRIEPDNGEAYWWRARAYHLSGSPLHAIDDYTAAIPLASRFAAASHYARGRLYLGEKAYEKAFADFTEATRLEPESPSAWRHQCVALLLTRRDPLVTAAACTKAVDLDGESGDAKFYAGLAALQLKDVAAAAPMFSGCQTVRPGQDPIDDAEDVAVRCGYGFGLASFTLAGADAGKRAAARKLMDDALLKDPKADLIFRNFGLVP